MREQHIFPNDPVPQGEAYITETCICGVQARRYRTGSRRYLDENGKQISYTPPHVTEVGINTESLLKDATWIIKLMHEDLVQNGIYSVGREKAENFLQHQKQLLASPVIV